MWVRWERQDAKGSGAGGVGRLHPDLERMMQKANSGPVPHDGFLFLVGFLFVFFAFVFLLLRYYLKCLRFQSSLIREIRLCKQDKVCELMCL